jgi:hypothetical protein
MKAIQMHSSYSIVFSNNDNVTTTSIKVITIPLFISTPKPATKMQIPIQNEIQTFHHCDDDIFVEFLPRKATFKKNIKCSSSMYNGSSRMNT